MSDKEQNKKINELNRRVAKLEAAVKSIDLDLEPSGRISNAFEQIEDHLDEHDRKLDKLQYDLNQANGKLDAILDRLTGLSDLPDEWIHKSRYTRKINSYTSTLSPDSIALFMIQNTENQLAESSSFELMNEAIKAKCVRHSHYLR